MTTLTRSLVIFLLTLGCVSAGYAAPKDELAHNRQIRLQAVKLFRAHQPEEAVAQLRANVHALQPGADRDLAVVQELIETAYDFYNTRDAELMSSAAIQALTTADKLLAGKRHSPELSRLCTHLGQMCEIVLADPEQAQAYYALAVQVDGNSREAQERLQRVSKALAAHNSTHR